MHAQQAARILARRAGFAAEARRVGRVLQGQLLCIQNLVTVNVGHRHFRRRNEKEIVRVRAVHVFLKLGKLSRARHHLAAHHKRRPDFLVAVLLDVQVEHPASQRAQQARTVAFEQRELRSRDLRAPGKIQDVQRRANIPVRLLGKVKLRLLAPDRMDDVFFLCQARRHTAVGHIRNLQHCFRNALLDLSHLAVQALDALAHGAHLLAQRRHRRFILGGADGLRRAVALRL